MASLVTVLKTSDLKPGQGKAVEVGGKTIALFNVGGTYYAMDDTCTHVGGPLSEGSVSGTTVTCPWHGAEFDVTCGKHLAAPAPEDVSCYKVQVSGDDIQVEV